VRWSKPLFPRSPDSDGISKGTAFTHDEIKAALADAHDNRAGLFLTREMDSLLR
jgi:hypothetical protein